MQFQFHYGSIKSRAISRVLYASDYFNSTMVRLKVTGYSVYNSFISNFNSTMVRLKGAMAYYSRATASRFQFHYGSIKRECKIRT